ncbi:predicted protein [Nematostella vectensis]|uniref:Ion transport domain-containing protein n=1 Tax=Nematostella vectensis TaxID=45351 RepID=A7SKJ6_NEMVE|nr:predicted protein [Nematostella vectensis]|eukprot:XP_001627833.1 predicted protein [Nematostella vectensis]
MATDPGSATDVVFGEVSEGEATEKKGFFIHPRSRAYRTWETCNVFFCFLTFVIAPFQASFDSNITFLWAVVYLLDALFLFDIVSKFHLAFFEKASIITDKARIRRNYIKGRFLLDLLSVLPLDLIALWLTVDKMEPSQVLAFVRLNRLLRLHRIMQYFATAFSITLETIGRSVLKHPFKREAGKGSRLQDFDIGL